MIKRDGYSDKSVLSSVRATKGFTTAGLLYALSLYDAISKLVK